MEWKNRISRLFDFVQDIVPDIHLENVENPLLFSIHWNF
jgi:hypothetical protein